jgi:uncharacterized protein GlcG (DUF336 family)
MNTTRTITTITLDGALKAVNIALSEAEKLGVKISVAVVDPSMNLIAFAKADGATPHSVETSRRKANTSASTGKPTGWMQENLAITLPLGSGNLLTNIPGGMPLKFNEGLVGGLGIAGGTVKQDETIAKTALKNLGADPVE